MGDKIPHFNSKFHHVLTEEFLRKRYIEEKKNASEIAAEIGTTSTTVCQYLRKLGFAVRSCAEIRYNPVDSSGFENLVDDWHAYWVGFLAADGCIFLDKRKNAKILRLALQESDIEHLTNFQIGIKTSLSIRVAKNNGFGENHKLAVLSIHDHRLVDALAQWGVVPSKSLDLQWPDKMPECLIPAYIRGFFDGDGTVYQRHRKRKEGHIGWTETACRFITGSTEFLDQLESVLNQHGIHTNKRFQNLPGKAYVLPLSGNRDNLLRFADFIYQGCTVCLERKKTIFDSLREPNGDSVSQLELLFVDSRD